MRYTTVFVAALAIAAGRVAAQDDTTDPTATDSADGPDATDGPDDTGMPACAMACTETAATSSGCADPTDTTCLCTSDAFINAVTQCVITTCSAADQAAAASMADELCPTTDPTESISASASSAIASATSSIAAAASSAASSARASASSAVRSSASVVSHSASASASASAAGNAGTALKMPSVSFLALGATALGFVVGPLLLFA
ncbi:hypothetical protein M407DRAFT_242817 [Tulasnella calospora MUT 4182]|uniref:CFEM domain-containing protein n=1 Tax=Tulasnella calospora MUT 4182 TaxID=1051891 RepID=A0A0C3L555_9AGAM|nr:hypothetical protein M407DRAFT_242817 [Tulasnella calospora MUT 4182]